MNTYPEHKLVQKCLLQIEEKLGWGTSAQWHNDVFIELSDTIQQNTQVLLSPTTLKRVWGKVNYTSAPSISTLNTLSQFAGYANWRDFKNEAEAKKPSWIHHKVASNFGVIITSAAIMTVVFISFYSMVGSGNVIAEEDLSRIEFSSRPVTEGLPNSVVFDFDLKNIESDSIYIQQFWDVTKTVKISTAQQQATGIYYFPGYFRAKLLVEGKIIKEHDLFIKSNGWVGTIDYDPVPKYFSEQEVINNKLSFPNTALNEIASNEKPIVSSFHFVKDFGTISADNFSLSTSVKNTYAEKWAVCQAVRIVVLGTQGAMVIPFSIPGCVSDINLMLNDTYVRGKEHDLSMFGVDFSDPRNIEIDVKQKQVTVLVDNTEVYRGNYQKSVGDLVGFRYRFLGAGEVGHLKITGPSNNTVYMDEGFGNN